MKPKPVPEHTKPTYPTRREFLAGSAAAMLVAGCGDSGLTGSMHPIVAPIFDHGVGRGAWGCVVVSPPVFLSEEEAVQVIKEELAKAGVSLGVGMPLGEVTIEHVVPWQQTNDKWLGEKKPTVSHTVSLAAVDCENRVGIEFVSQEDCDQFSGRGFSTVQSFDTKGLAGRLGRGIRDQGKEDLRIGIFYDPLEKLDFSLATDAMRKETEENDEEDPRSRFERIEATAKNKSKVLLRQQAQDFVAWLKKN